MSVELLSILFLILSGTMAIIVLSLLYRYLEDPARSISITIFGAWLGYATVLGLGGRVASKHPPGLLFLLLPVLLFLVLFLVRSPGVRAFASRVPVEMLVGLQVFRVFVEIGLYGLYVNHLIPRLMTFEGGNLDVFIGLSAPVVAWLYSTGQMNARVVRAWSWIGIVVLTNIVGRAVLTSTGMISSEIPNIGLGLFPFTFIPGFLAPLALYLHVLLLRSLPRKTSP